MGCDNYQLEIFIINLKSNGIILNKFFEGFNSLVVACTVQLRRTKTIKHSEGLLLTFVNTSTQTCHNGRKEVMILIYGYKSARVLPLTCLSMWCTFCFCWFQTQERILVPKHSRRYYWSSNFRGAYYYWEGILMRVLQHYQIPLTLTTFVNYYMFLNSRRLSNQALWLSNRIVMPVFAAGAASSYTYVVMLGWSSSMAKHPVTN
jgi:hypothetical protein